MYLMLGKNITATGKNRDIRYKTPCPRRWLRHRSPCARTASIRLETNCTTSWHPDAAAMGRGSSRFDVEQCDTHHPDKLHFNVEHPNNTNEAHHELRIFELLGVWTHPPSKISHPDAKKTCRSKLPGSGDDIGQGELLRGGAQWLEAHRMVGHRARHAWALATVC